MLTKKNPSTATSRKFQFFISHRKTTEIHRRKARDRETDVDLLLTTPTSAERQGRMEKSWFNFTLPNISIRIMLSFFQEAAAEVLLTDKPVKTIYLRDENNFNYTLVGSELDLWIQQPICNSIFVSSGEKNTEIIEFCEKSILYSGMGTNSSMTDFTRCLKKSADEGCESYARVFLELFIVASVFICCFLCKNMPSIIHDFTRREERPVVNNVQEIASAASDQPYQSLDVTRNNGLPDAKEQSVSQLTPSSSFGGINGDF